VPNQTAVDILTSRLGSLVYPGDDKSPAFAIPLPMFRTDGQPPEAAEGYQTIAKLIAAAIVHLIETETAPGGTTIMANTEIAQLRAAAGANEHLRHRQPRITCNCGSGAFSLNIRDFDTDHPKVYLPTLIKALSNMSPECALGHQVVH
jgi:hypothetical protein